MAIQDIISLIEQSHTTPDNLGVSEVFLNSVAKDSVNKYDQGIKIGKSKTKDLLESQDYLTKLQELGFNLSKDGKDWALVAFKVEGKPFVDYARVHGAKTVLGVLQEVYLATGEFYKVGEAQYGILIEFELENGKVYRSSGYIDDEGQWVQLEEKVDYGMTYIPVVLMKNNSLGFPDIPTELRPMLNTLEHFLNSMKPEWEKVKSLFINNTAFNSVQDARVLENKIVGKGESFIDSADADGKLQNAIAPISLGVATLQQLNAQIGFVEGKILKMAHQFRDHAGGTYDGKTDLSLAMFNQQAFEYMMTKIAFRERQLKKFIALVADMLGEDAPTVKIVISEFEQYRIDALKAEVDLAVANAEQARGIAAKNHSEAKSLEAGTMQPNTTAGKL